MSEIQFLIWGTRSGKENICHSKELNPNDRLIKYTLEDVGGYFKFTNLDKIFYSIDYNENSTVFTQYKTIRDRLNRTQGCFRAVSIFIPNEKIFKGKYILSSLINLSDSFDRKYLVKNKIEQGDLDIDGFSECIKLGNSKFKALKKSSNTSKDYAYVYYKSEEELSNLLNHPYLSEYDQYKEIFLLKNGGEVELLASTQESFTELNVNPENSEFDVKLKFTGEDNKTIDLEEYEIKINNKRFKNPSSLLKDQGNQQHIDGVVYKKGYTSQPFNLGVVNDLPNYQGDEDVKLGEVKVALKKRKFRIDVIVESDIKNDVSAPAIVELTYRVSSNDIDIVESIPYGTHSINDLTVDDVVTIEVNQEDNKYFIENHKKKNHSTIRISDHHNNSDIIEIKFKIVENKTIKSDSKIQTNKPKEKNDKEKSEEKDSKSKTEDNPEWLDAVDDGNKQKTTNEGKSLFGKFTSIIKNNFSKVILSLFLIAAIVLTVLLWDPISDLFTSATSSEEEIILGHITQQLDSDTSFNNILYCKYIVDSYKANFSKNLANNFSFMELENFFVENESLIAYTDFKHKISSFLSDSLIFSNDGKKYLTDKYLEEQGNWLTLIIKDPIRLDLNEDKFDLGFDGFIKEQNDLKLISRQLDTFQLLQKLIHDTIEMDFENPKPTVVNDFKCTIKIKSAEECENHNTYNLNDANKKLLILEGIDISNINLKKEKLLNPRNGKYKTYNDTIKNMMLKNDN